MKVVPPLCVPGCPCRLLDVVQVRTSRGAPLTLSLRQWLGLSWAWTCESQCGGCSDGQSLVGIGTWTPGFSKLDVLGARFPSVGLKSWGSQCGVRALTCQGEARGVSPTLAMGPSAGGGINDEMCPSSSGRFPPTWPICLHCSASLSGFSKEEIDPYVAINSACLLWAVSSASFYVTIFLWFQFSFP